MLIAGNWKMHKDLDAGLALVRSVGEAIATHGDGLGSVEVAVCPPYIHLAGMAEMLSDTPVRWGAQNMHAAEEGAYTGEISAPMLQSVGCTYVILGHSERRQYFGETDASVNEKLLQAQAHSLVPILCVGETKAQRDSGEARAVVRKQVMAALSGVTLDSANDLVIAYEPIWAIGTGDTATPEQAQEMHAYIRGVAEDAYSPAISEELVIQYGGSMKPHNAADLLSQPDINGGLIGGASLQANDSVAIAEAGARATAA